MALFDVTRFIISGGENQSALFVLTVLYVPSHTGPSAITLSYVSSQFS